MSEGGGPRSTRRGWSTPLRARRAPPREMRCGGAKLMAEKSETGAVLQLPMGILRLANDRRARNRLIRFVAEHSDLSARELGKRIGISHASVARIRRNQQGRGETGARSRAAYARIGGARARRGEARLTQRHGTPRPGRYLAPPL